MHLQKACPSLVGGFIDRAGYSPRFSGGILVLCCQRHDLEGNYKSRNRRIVLLMMNPFMVEPTTMYKRPLLGEIEPHIDPNLTPNQVKSPQSLLPDHSSSPMSPQNPITAFSSPSHRDSMNSPQVLPQVIPPHKPIRSSLAASKSAKMRSGTRMALLMTVKFMNSCV